MEKENKKYLYLILGCIIINIIAALVYYNYCDLYTFNFQWVKMLENSHLFGIYSDTSIPITVDYPPLYLIMLWTISKPALLFFNHNDMLFQLTMKIYPLIFYMLSIKLISKKTNLKNTFLWAVNIGLLINVSLWGQTDAILAYFMFLMFFAMKDDKTKLVGIYFALCCLTKLQGGYLLPIYILYLITSKNEIKEKILSFIYGLATGILVWLPFMVVNKNILLPFKIYIGGFGQYKVVNCGASNIYLDFYEKGFNSKASIINYILLIVCLIILIQTYRKTKDLILSSACFLFAIYMITFSQHERYGFYSMTLFFLIYIYENKYLSVYILSIISVAITQIMPLLKSNVLTVLLLNDSSEKIIDATRITYNNYIFYICIIALVLNIIIAFRLKNIKKIKKNKK